MTSKDDLNSEVRKILQEEWTCRVGRVVPESSDLGLGNEAVKLDAAVLYADLDDSTKLVDSTEPWFATEVYKSYLVCAARLISAEGGEITAYDGDRIMAVFISASKESSAVRTALKLNFIVNYTINPAIKDQYPNCRYSMKQVVGIDTSELFVARTGIRGANDLVWVGRAANYAAKLATRNGAPTQITAEVYKRLDQRLKTDRNGRPVWSYVFAPGFLSTTVYESTCFYGFD